MQQSIQSDLNIQPLEESGEARPQDDLMLVPTGKAWFDVVPPEHLVHEDMLSVVIYPDNFLLQHHMVQCRRRGYLETMIAAFEQDMPPHLERELWEKVQRRHVSVILMTAPKFQSIKTLGQLTRHGRISRIFIEQGHRLLSDLWDPLTDNPYEKLPSLFQHQWQNRPSLTVLSYPLSSNYLPILAAKLGIESPPKQDSLFSLDNLDISVKRCITQHQKTKALQLFMEQPCSGSKSLTVVIFHAAKQFRSVQSVVMSRPAWTWSRSMLRADKERFLEQLTLHDHPVVLVDEASLAELPTEAFQERHVKIVLWQLPWSCDALLQKVMLQGGEPNSRRQVMLLYTKEDYFLLKEAFSYRFSPRTRTTPILLDHLTRMRQFCRQSLGCRQVQLKEWLLDRDIKHQSCGRCDSCVEQPTSSLWRNLVNTFLY